MKLTLKTGKEYLLIVLDSINDLSLNNLIRNNIAYNTEDKNKKIQKFWKCK